ncbi:MAG TPA: MMPL family transporter, partial [Algoriphagus sp.]|nr:MMPL family transporter [Algoriphagus sp.]
MFRKPTALAFLGIGIFLSFFILIFPPLPSFDYDFEQFFPEDDPDLAFYRQFEKDFESDNDYLLIALQNPEGELADKNFLTGCNLLKEEILGLDGVDTLISVLDLEMPKIGLFGINFRKVLDWETEENLQESKSQLAQLEGSLVSKDGKSLLFLIKNDPSLTKEQGDSLYLQIRQVFSENEITPIAVAGKIQTQGDFVTLMQKEFGLFLGASLILMLVALWLIFRSWWGVVIPVLVLSLGILWAFSLILFSGKALDIMSVMQPTIFLIVGLSALIHYFTQLIKKLNADIPKDQAVFESFRELTFAVWLTVFTTSVGFLSLYFTSIPALKAFGLWTGIGILMVFLALILITPGLLYLFPISKTRNTQPKSFSFLHLLFSKIISNRKPILLGFLGITGLCLVLGFQLKVNGFLLDNLPQDHPIQQDFAFFDQQFGGSNPLEIYLEVGHDTVSLLDYEVLLEMEKLEKKLRESFGENQFISPLSMVKALNQAQNQGSLEAFTFPSQGQYLRMERYFKPMLNSDGPKVISTDQKSGRISSRVPDLGSFEMAKKRAEILEFVQKEINPN